MTTMNTDMLFFPRTSPKNYPKIDYSLNQYLTYHVGMAIHWSAAIERMDSLRIA